MLRHVAMFRWKDKTTDEQKQAARDALAALKEQVPSVVEYTVGFDIVATQTTGTWCSWPTSRTRTGSRRTSHTR